MSSPSGTSSDYDHSFKIVLIGDSGVGKSTLILNFITGAVTDIPNTIGVDIKMKQITVGKKRLKLTIWDTAGQERYRTLKSSYYRDAFGIILVYDVTRKQTFDNLANLWAKEVELYNSNKDCVKLLVGNKVDKESERAVSTEEGMALAKKHGFFFLEATARARENAERCFEDLAIKMLEELEKRKKLEELEKRKKLEELEKRKQLEELEKRKQLEELEKRKQLEELEKRKQLEELENRKQLEELEKRKQQEALNQKQPEKQPEEPPKPNTAAPSGGGGSSSSSSGDDDGWCYIL